MWGPMCDKWVGPPSPTCGPDRVATISKSGHLRVKLKYYFFFQFIHVVFFQRPLLC